MPDSFDDRRKALEEQFFQKHDKELVQKLKDTADKAASKEELKQLTGITNEQVLDALGELKMGGAATLVMSLYPIIHVAWADGSITAAERKVVLDLARTIGLEADSPAHEYLSKWLSEKPELSWHSLWAEYVKALVAQMKPDDKLMLKNTVLGRARLVAEASGGFLGLAFRVSSAEKACLDEMDQLFS